MQDSNWEQVKHISFSPEPGAGWWECSVSSCLCSAHLSWACTAEFRVPCPVWHRAVPSPLQGSHCSAPGCSQPTWKCDSLGRHRADPRRLQGAGLVHGVHGVDGALGKRRKNTFFFPPQLKQNKSQIARILWAWEMPKCKRVNPWERK